MLFDLWICKIFNNCLSFFPFMLGSLAPFPQSLHDWLCLNWGKSFLMMQLWLATHHQLLSSCWGHHHSLRLGSVGVFGIGGNLQVFLVIQVKLWKRSSFWSLECVEELLDLVGYFPAAGSSPILWKMIESVSPPVWVCRAKTRPRAHPQGPGLVRGSVHQQPY